MSETPAPLHLHQCGCCDSEFFAPAGRAQGCDLIRCSTCGTLRFTEVGQPAEIYRDGYHEGGSEYGWDYASPTTRAYEEAMANARLAWIEEFHSPARLLDVGGGVGYLSAAAGGRGWAAELLEPVAAAVNFAREHFGVTGHVGGADAISSLPSGAFDVICFIHCIEHVAPARETLAAAARALSPGGHLVIEVPNHASAARRLEGDDWLGWQAGEHVYVFDRRSLTGLVRRAGFEPIAVRTTVPGYGGMDADGYAYMLGLQGVLAAGVRVKRRLARSPVVASSETAPGPKSPRAARPVDDETGLRGVVYGRGFPALKFIEERTGLGTNLQLIARPSG